ncbi:MAG: S8 family serine peptidase [Ruegeria sp.]|uniref:S8 family serine peptidase n=1 Tax=Ruegeria sp. TaxID=1879320 RepID=UPI00349EE02C
MVNFSVGIKGSHFAGRISSLARLLDWWADQQGILFHVSAGNVPDALTIPDMTVSAFEDATPEDRRDHIEAAQRNARHKRTLMAPAEAMNIVTVGAASLDETAPSAPLQAGVIPVHEDGDLTPAVSSAIGLGAFRSIKPDFLALSGEHEVRATPAAKDIRLSVVTQTQRTGLNVATVQRGNPSTYRTRGTSCANAMASRASLFAAAALTAPNGPFDGLDVTTRDQALISKALSVNAARWPEAALARYDREMIRLEGNHNQAREEVCRYYGHGTLNEALMREAPDYGATLIGTGTLRKDKAAIFNVPMPPSLAGERIGRSMSVTIAWFSPVLATRARYRLALLEAVAHGHDLFGGLIADDGWALDMKVGQLNKNIIKRGTVWSHRMIHNGATVPNFDGNSSAQRGTLLGGLGNQRNEEAAKDLGALFLEQALGGVDQNELAFIHLTEHVELGLRVREHPLEGLVLQHPVETSQHLRFGVGKFLAVELGLEKPARCAVELGNGLLIGLGAARLHQLTQRVDGGAGDMEHEPGDIAEHDALFGGHRRA